MKLTAAPKRKWGFGLAELVVVLASLIAIALLLVMLPKAKARKSRVQCVSNAKQAALGFRMWADDHSEQFPWEVSTNDGGSKEFLGTGKVFAHFQCASNEFNTPKILVCPIDTNRSFVPIRDAINWPQIFSFLNNSNISYFAGVNAKVGELRLLTGDRHISTNAILHSGILQIPTASDLKWAPALHGSQGNLATADGAAYQVVAGSTNFIQSFTFPALLEIP